MNRKKNILIIAGHFPPASTSTSIRVTNIAKYLYKKGWAINVLTTNEERATFRSIYDKTLINKLNKNINIYRSFGGIISYFFSKVKKEHTKHTLENLREKTKKYLIPDAWIEWAPFAFIKLLKIIYKHKINIIISLSYPFTSHLIGYFAHFLAKVKWITDFGDPWCYSPEFKHVGISKIINKKLEKIIFKTANLITVTTNETAKLYKCVYPSIDKKIVVIPMGYDEDDFSKKIIQRFDKFTLLHAGSIYKPHRNPIPLFEAFSILKKNYPYIYKNIQLIHLGYIEEDFVRILKKMDIIEETVFLYNWVPFEESLNWMLRCDILLLFGNIGGIQIPGKIYSYFRACKPILMLKEIEKDPVAQMILNVNRGVSISNNTKDIVKTLLQLYDINSKKQISSRFNLSKNSIKKYSWEKIINSLSKEMERLLKENN